MEQGFKIYKFSFKREWPVFADVTANSAVVEMSDEKELLRVLMKEKSGLVILGVSGKDDLIKASVIQKALRNLKGGNVRVVAINFNNNRSFDPIFTKLGIQDVLDMNIPAKTLKTKIDLWGRSLVKKESAEKTVTRKENQRAEESKLPTSDKVNWQDSLVLEDDVWLVSSDSNCLKILGRWSVKFVGPGPFVSTWEEKSSGHWTFKVSDEYAEIILPESGIWHFEGEQKPDFVWSENKWLVAGKVFRLYYEKDGITHEKFRIKDKILTVSKDSPYAKEKQSILNETFDKSLHLKKEAEKISSDEVKSETERLENLNGKISTDDLSSPMLEGDIETQDKIKGFLEGKGKTENRDDSPLEGEWNPDDLSSPNLDHEANTRDQWQQNLDGKGKTGRVETPELEGDLGTDDLSSPNLDTEGHTRDPWQQNLEGKTSTDKIVQPPLSSKKPSGPVESGDDLSGDIENPEDFNEVDKYYKGGEGFSKEKEKEKEEEEKEKLRKENDTAFYAQERSSLTHKNENKSREHEENEESENTPDADITKTSDDELGDEDSEPNLLSLNEHRHKNHDEREEAQKTEKKKRDHEKRKPKIEEDFNPEDESRSEKTETIAKDRKISKHAAGNETIDGYLRSSDGKKKEDGPDSDEDSLAKKKKSLLESDFTDATKTKSKTKKQGEAQRELTASDLTREDRKNHFREFAEKNNKKKKSGHESLEQLDFDPEADDMEELEAIIDESRSGSLTTEDDKKQGTEFIAARIKTKALGEYELPLIAPVSYLKTSHGIFETVFSDYIEGQIFLHSIPMSVDPENVSFKFMFKFCGKDLELNLNGKCKLQDGEILIDLNPDSRQKMEKILPLFEELQTAITNWVKLAQGR